MQETNRLGLRVVVLTAIVLVVLAGLYFIGRAILNREPAAPEDSSVALSDVQKDTDNDGVADYYEATFYGTDITNADTDGDGVSDLQEITGGRDPLVPGPQDVSKPATGEQVADQNTFTRQYLASLPTDAQREDILDQAQLEAFVAANRGSLLPEIDLTRVQTSEASGAAAVNTYLESISSVHDSGIEAVSSTDIESAFRLLVNSGNAEPMEQIIGVLDNNIEILGSLVVPREALDLHTKLLAASIALRDSAQQLRDINLDFVGGLIAARNVEDLGPIFQEIAQEVAALEGEYGLE